MRRSRRLPLACPLLAFALLAGALLACSPDPAPPPASLPAAGSPAQGGQAGEAGMSGASGQAGEGGTGAQAGAAGQPGGAGQGGGDGGASGNAGQPGTGGSAGEAGSAAGEAGAAGVGGSAGEAGNAGQSGCEDDGDCAAQGACRPCEPLRYACPEVRCVAGQCEETEALCAGKPCAPVAAVAVGPCEFSLGWRWDGVACGMLLGCSCEGPNCGALAASEADCWEGREGCLDPGIPCAGKPCGAPCSPCPPWASCLEAPYSCDAAGTCGEGEPFCPSCLVDAECVSPPPLACPNGVLVTPSATCEGGACIVPPYECPPFNICDDTNVFGSAVPGCPFEFYGFFWFNGACREFSSCGVDNPELLQPDWTSCQALREGCPGTPCQGVEDCHVVTECPLCPGGESACPSVACVAGACAYTPGVCP